MEGRTHICRLGNGTLTDEMKFLDPLLNPVLVQWVSGSSCSSVGSSPHVMRICKRFLEDAEINTIDWPLSLAYLNLANTSGIFNTT